MEDNNSTGPSRLYSLEPIGIGTPEVECLSGYIKRLAVLHMVSVSNLINKELIPDMSDPSLSIIEFLHCRNSLNSLASNLFGEVINILEQKTYVKGLSYLTMRPYKNIFNPNAMLRKHLAWCPICFEEGQKSGKLYEKLIWQIKDIEICKEHQVKLVQNCPFCNSQIPILYFRSRVGYCSKCNAWLGSIDISEKDINMLNYHNCINENISELFVNSRGIDYNSDLFSKNLKKIMELNNLTLPELARISNLPKVTISSWLYTRSLPSFSKVLPLSYNTGYSLYELFGLEIDHSKKECKQVKRAYRDSYRLNLSKVKLLLDEAINSNGEISITKLCSNCKIDYRSIKKYFPEEFNILCNRRKGLNEKHLDLRNVMVALHQQGIYPSKNAIKHELNKNIFSNKDRKMNSLWILALNELGYDVNYNAPIR